MSAERSCFTRREIRNSLGARSNRKANTKNYWTGYSRTYLERHDLEHGSRKSQRPRGKVGEKINKIRQTCDCEVHREMRGEADG